MMDRAFVTELFAGFTLNLIIQAMTSALETNLCFLMGFTFWSIHFMYYFCTFLILLCICGRNSRIEKLPWNGIIFMVIAEMVFSTSSSTIYHGGSDGAVNSIHVVDWLLTVGIICGSKYFLDSGNSFIATDTCLLVVLGIFSSMCWLESIIYVTPFVVLAWPLLAVSRSFIYITAHKTFSQTNRAFGPILIYTFGICSVLSLPLAVLFKVDKFNEGQENFGLDRMYSIITPELTLLLLSIPLFFGSMCTNYWLIFNCQPETYLIAYHLKYLFGSIWAWLMTSTSSATVYSTVGKICTSVVLAALFIRKWRTYKADVIIDSSA